MKSTPLGTHPSAQVFPTYPTHESRRKNFLRAGIAVVVAGEHAELDGFQGTLGTMPARDGTTPQVAMKIMRRTRYSTTLTEYPHLPLAENSSAIAALNLTGTQ